MSVYLTQCLCPQRHAIIALAFEAESDHEAVAVHQPDMIARMKTFFKSGAINAHCGICGSTELFFETGRTRFKTVDEATPALEHTELLNLLSRLELDQRGETYDVKRKN